MCEIVKHNFNHTELIKIKITSNWSIKGSTAIFVLDAAAYGGGEGSIAIFALEAAAQAAVKVQLQWS